MKDVPPGSPLTITLAARSTTEVFQSPSPPNPNPSAISRCTARWVGRIDEPVVLRLGVFGQVRDVVDRVVTPDREHGQEKPSPLAVDVLGHHVQDEASAAQ